MKALADVQKLDFPPGSGWAYSNANSGLLAEVVDDQWEQVGDGAIQMTPTELARWGTTTPPGTSVGRAGAAVLEVPSPSRPTQPGRQATTGPASSDRGRRARTWPDPESTARGMNDAPQGDPLTNGSNRETQQRLPVAGERGWLSLTASSWIVGFSLGWGDMAREDRDELQRHFSMGPAGGSGTAETWEVRVRSDTAASAVHEVSLMLGPERQQQLVQISAATDLADGVRAAESW